MTRIPCLLLSLALLAPAALAATNVIAPRNRSSGGTECQQVNVSGTLTNTLCLDPSSGSARVGIGTTSPAYTLDVTGQAVVRSGLSVLANVRGTEGTGTTTLTDADNREQVFNLSAGRTVVLPTTNIKAGDVWVFDNLSASNDLTVQSSNTTSLTVANGANQDATVRGGYVVLRALVNSPTTPANWLVEKVNESFSLSGTPTSNTGTPNGATATVLFTRNNRSFNVNSAMSMGNNASWNSMVLSSFAPVRFRPSNSVYSYISTGNPNQASSLFCASTISSAGTLSSFVTSLSGATVSTPNSLVGDTSINTLYVQVAWTN
jgi:hypothetical protein